MSVGRRDDRNIDPTAGVTLARPLRRCPRCGYVKGEASHARPGLCSSCVKVLTRDEAKVWRAA